VVGCCEHGNEPSGSVKDRETSYPAVRQSGSEQGVCSTELINKTYVELGWGRDSQC
jgi:hypothetical protein